MKKYRFVFRTILFSVIVTCIAFRDAATAAPPAYTVTDLGTLGGTLSVAYGINDSGQVTGNSNMTGDVATHAFLWTPTVPNGTSGALNDLGTLGGTDSYGQGINDSGQVAGFSLTTGDAADNAFLWTPTMPNGTSGTMNGLGTLGGTHSNGFGINSSGQVAGQAQTGDVVFAPFHAFLYDGALNDLGTLGGRQSYGYDINDTGQMTGFSTTTGNAPDHAFLYDGALHDLGTLGGSYSAGFGINASGQVAGQSYTTGDAAMHAFLYNGAMNDLGTLGGTYSIGIGINASGHITGGSQTAGDAATHAFLYTSGSGMVDLNSQIDSLSGWELYQARAINDAGQITGYGFHGGQPRAFLLTPVVPEPATWMLFCLGSVAVAVRRARGGVPSKYRRPQMKVVMKRQAFAASFALAAVAAQGNVR